MTQIHKILSLLLLAPSRSPASRSPKLVAHSTSVPEVGHQKKGKIDVIFENNTIQNETK